MLRYISEEDVLPSNARIVFHYLIRLGEEALFIDQFTKIKEQFGELLDLHIWITRRESVTAQSRLEFPAHLKVRAQIASTPQEVGNPWDWWHNFTTQTMEHFDHTNNHNKSLVYICGPQALTDRLVDLYKLKGLGIEDGHIQIEKWW